nr:uncharacterized protein LOC129384877 [Dermacentor andersoni]
MDKEGKKFTGCFFILIKNPDGVGSTVTLADARERPSRAAVETPPRRRNTRRGATGSREITTYLGGGLCEPGSRSPSSSRLCTSAAFLERALLTSCPVDIKPSGKLRCGWICEEDTQRSILRGSGSLRRDCDLQKEMELCGTAGFESEVHLCRGFCCCCSIGSSQQFCCLLLGVKEALYKTLDSRKGGSLLLKE